MGANLNQVIHRIRGIHRTQVMDHSQDTHQIKAMDHSQVILQIQDMHLKADLVSHNMVSVNRDTKTMMQKMICSIIQKFEEDSFAKFMEFLW